MVRVSQYVHCSWQMNKQLPVISIRAAPWWCYYIKMINKTSPQSTRQCRDARLCCYEIFRCVEQCHQNYNQD